MKFNLPPIITNTFGNDRHVGLELECNGLDLQPTANMIQDLYGGSVIKHQRYLYEVKDTSLGSFKVELDAQLLQKMADSDPGQKLPIPDEIRKLLRESLDELESFVDRLAMQIVPIEIVMPPVPVRDMHQLEKLRSQLSDHQVKGTEESLFYAFGLHINAELPDLEARTIVRYIQAFLVLYPWLKREHQVDISRRISPFIEPFSAEYVERVTDPDYRPPLTELINDYLQHNATRNRPLDLLPVFHHLAPDTIDAFFEDEKIRPRPALHYRLPNSSVESADWSFAEEWNRWNRVEVLAHKPDTLDTLLYKYQQMEQPWNNENHWIKNLEN